METSPCKDCPERCYNCHSTCGRYRKYSIKRKAISARTRSEDLRAYYCEKYARIGKKIKGGYFSVKTKDISEVHL